MASSTTVIIKQDCGDGRQIQVATTLDRVTASIERQKCENREALLKFIEERVDCPPHRDPLGNESQPIYCAQCDFRFAVGERFYRHLGMREEFDSMVIFFQHQECQRQWMLDYLAGEIQYPMRATPAEIEEFRQKYELLEDRSHAPKIPMLYYFAPRQTQASE